MKQTLYKIIAGSVASQMIGLVSVPLLLSLYSAADLGYYGFFISASTVLSTLISLRIENLMFSVSLRQARALFNLVSCVLFFAILVIGLLSYCLILINPQYELYWSAVACALALAQFNIAYGFVVRQGRTNRHVVGRIVRNLGELAAIVGCMVADRPIETLPWLILLTYAIAAVFLGIDLIRFDFLENLSGLRVMRKNVAFLKNDFLASLFSSAALNMPVLFFYKVGAPEISGIFFSVSRLLGTPALMIAQSVGTTLKQHATAERIQKGTCGDSIRFVVTNVLRRWLLAYFAIGCLVVAGTYGWYSGSSNVFAVVTILVPMFFARYVYNCIGSIVYVLRLQRANLLFQLSLLLAVTLALFLPSAVMTSLVLYSCLSSFVYLVFFFKLVRLGK